MKNIYIMRHGETLFNVQGRTQGWCDSPLTTNGIAQARLASAFMSKFPVHFDHFYCSTQERACDTMELVFPGARYKRLKGLKEMSFGQFEGHPQYLEVQDKTSFFKQFGGESREEVAARMLATLLDIAAESDTRNIFCISHGAAVWSLLTHLLGRRPTELGGFHNLEMMHFVYDEEAKKLVFKKKIVTLEKDDGLLA